MIIKFKLLNKDARLPERATPGAAGFDLVSVEEISLAPGAFHAVSTGLAIELPPGFEGQVRPRSGLAAKHGVTVLNAPGTIDEDYRGEVKVILINHGPGTFDIKPGMRIAQLVPAMTARAMVEEMGSLQKIIQSLDVCLVEDFTPTDRGTGGFGSTGV